MCFFEKFIFYPLLYLEVELLIVIQLYFITVNWLPTFENDLLPQLQKVLIAAPKSITVFDRTASCSCLTTLLCNAKFNKVTMSLNFCTVQILFLGRAIW